ncbi:MAG: PAS domain-containing sensor histidine kinase [Marinifilaceae bacterium]
MIYKRFYIGIVSQVILIALTPILFLWVWSREYMLVTSYSLILLWVFQVVYLIWYINKINRDLTRFFLAFRYKDSTMVFNEKQKDPSFQKLYDSFNQIIKAFGDVKIEKEKDFTFFQNTVQHVGVGLLAFNQTGKVRLCNRAFQDLFQMEDFSNIQDLERIEKDFPLWVQKISSGKHELRKFYVDNEIRKLAVKAVAFRLENEQLKLLSFQDIKNEIDQGEMDAWQKLIRVLTHEIMNSVSPITLLSSSLIDLYQRNGEIPGRELLTEGAISNTVMGLQTIRKRSKGLTAFVEQYRNLTQLPQPHFEVVVLTDFFARIELLFREECRKQAVEFRMNLPKEKVEVIADENLLSQVVINLIRNALQALNGAIDPKIEITVCTDHSGSCIRVEDNGHGISSEVIDNIFTPFFTTKEKGSGIGLSLSRQIMRLHGGTISVKSEPQKGTVFTLQF